jgi:hypothetical protein
VNNLSAVIYTDRSVKIAHRPVGVNNLSAFICTDRSVKISF